MEETLSEYEQLRARNIRRNEEVMRALGFTNEDVSLHRALARKTKAPKRDRDEPAGPTRRSTRLRGAQAPSAEEKRQEAAAAALSNAHASEAARWAGRQGRATWVGTASYKHTLNRFQHMSGAPGEKSLRTRMKRIEDRKGKNAVVKMRHFARVCYLEEAFDLYAVAAEALDRLIAVLGDEGADDDDDDENADDAPGGPGPSPA